MRIKIMLTPEQQSELQPLFDAVGDAMNRTSLNLKRDERGAIMGQCYTDGEVEFFFLTKPQALTVRAAIKRADIDGTYFNGNDAAPARDAGT